MQDKPIPDIIVSRLPIYLQALQILRQAGAATVSSQDLGRKVGITAAQIRKDLSQFGEFGKQGTGYPVSFLIEKLQQILHVDHVWDVAVVGLGELGHALARYQGFSNRGFRISMALDNDPAKIGNRIGNLEIQDARRLVPLIRAAGIRVAMITVPSSFAQHVADQLVEAGVQAILNYSPISLNVPPDVRLEYLDPSIGLQRMTYYLKV